jgi:hypothetical protein
MSQSVAGSVPSVLQVFAILFSNRWIGSWKKNWTLHKRMQSAEAASTPTGLSGEKGLKKTKDKAGKPAKSKKPPERFYERIFSLRITLWYLIFQRLNFDHTQAAVVRDLRKGGADGLRGRGRKLSHKVRSTKTSGYNQARQRLPLELVQGSLAHLGQHLLKLVGLAPSPKKRPGPNKRARQLLDGSTLALLKTPELAAAYAPASNQNGASDWSLMRILVGFCARSGAVLSAIEGAMEQSEQALAWKVIETSAAFTIWIGDRNFGVWSVAAQAVRHRQDVLVRLTGARAAKLAQGRPLQSGEDRRVCWSPSRHDQAAPGLERTSVSGRLIYVRLQKKGQWIDLWLFTTLDASDYPVELLVKWYGQRWQAELHFRSVKTQMKMAELDVCSPEMARKEFYSGLLAYNLVRTVMWGAGERLESNLHTISFSQARRVLLEYLKAWGKAVAGPDNKSVGQLLAEVAKETLPKRRGERPSEVRRVRHRRQKFPPLKGSRAAARVREGTTKSL